MVKDAEQFAEEDRKKREEVQTRNTADNAAYTAEKMLTDNAEKIPDDLKTEVEGHISAVRTALQVEDIGQIDAALTELQTAIQKGRPTRLQPVRPRGRAPST